MIKMPRILKKANNIVDEFNTELMANENWGGSKGISIRPPSSKTYKPKKYDEIK